MMRADITQPEITSSPTLVDAEEGLVVGQPNSEQHQVGPEFLGMVRNMVQRGRDTVFATWYDENGRMTSTHTFGDLWEEAGVIAHHLRCRWELEKDDHVVLCYNFGLHFFAAFLGCLRAGVVAVLVYPPTQPLARSLPKMDVVTKNCGAKLILCDADVMLLRDTDTINPFSKSRKLWPSDVVFQTTSTLCQQQGSGSSWWGNFSKQTKKQEVFDENNLQDSDVAFLQYTSGSTGEPKGVTITFGNLAANVKLLLDGVRQCHLQDPELGHFSNDEVVGFSWLPQYHDMGLVYGTIAPFVGGWQQHYMSPVAFIKKPLLWLELMSRHKATMGVAPDFAYRLVARKFLEARKRNGGQDPIPNLDLSSVRFLSNAAEPVRSDTNQLFGKLFARYGLRSGYSHIGYGLAEHVVTVCWFRGHGLSAKPIRSHVVAVGSRHTFHSSITVKIVDPDTLSELEDGEEGEVWVSSPCVAKGYFGKPDLSQEVFHAQCKGSPKEFLRSGDLGFFEDDKLFICGRIKDVIIVNGTNYFPQDIEAAVMDASEAVRSGCVAAFSRNENQGDQSVDIVFEIRKDFEKDALNVIALIRSAVAAQIGIVAGQVVAIKERTIPKTTSGKIQRRECRTRLKESTLPIVRASVPLQSGSGDSIAASQEELDSGGETVVPHELPHQKLPSELVEAIRSIELDHDLLSECFRELALDRLPLLVEAWNQFPKSTGALHSMCKEVIGSLESKQPSLVQFCHFALRQPASIIEQQIDVPTFLKSSVHAAFVLDWATREIASQPSLFELKVTDDEDFENSLTNQMEPLEVPLEGHFLTENGQSDKLFGRFDTFMWLKVRSVTAIAKRFISLHSSEDQNVEANEIDMVDGLDLLSANIMEAVWFDTVISRQTENAEVGQWLANQATPPLWKVQNGTVTQHYHHPKWCDVYKAWNFAFCMQLSEPKWTLAKLLIPSVSNSVDPTFLFNRLIALQMVSQQSTRARLTRQQSSPVFTRQAVQALGCLNRRWALSLSGGEKPPLLNSELTCSHRDFLDRLSTIHQHTMLKFCRTSDSLLGFDEETLGFDCQFEELLENILGCESDPNTTWDELRLSHGVFGQFRNDIASTFDLALEATAFEKYRNPAELKAHLRVKLAEQRVKGRVESLAASILGNPDPRMTWEDLGLSSMASVQLQNAIHAEFSIDIEADAFTMYETPSALGAFVASQQQGENAWSKDLSKLPKTRSWTISSWTVMAILQGIGNICHVLLFAFPIVPAYHVMSLVSSASLSIPHGRFVKWFWLPLALPVWMLGFSALIILSKWVVVGRYRTQEISVGSLAYLRWWWMDRAIHLWEFWVARYFTGTLLLWAFYRLLGARIHPSAKLDALIREFDLVCIKAGASIEHQVRCRRFSPWRADTEFPLLRFRPVQVGKDCVIKGMVGLGAVVGQGTHVSPCAVVPEGAQVPDNTKVSGCTHELMDKPGLGNATKEHWLWLGLLKLMWLVVQLYLFFGLLVAVQAAVENMIPDGDSWRLAPFCNWVLAIAIALCLHLILGIVLKWTILGRRQPGPVHKSTWNVLKCRQPGPVHKSAWQDFADWAVDYHFHVSVSFFMALFSNSVAWNVLLKLYGMDIDLESKVTATSFPPSKVDLIRIHQSFVSQASFDIEQNGEFQSINVSKSSIGYNVSVAPGVELSNAVIPPLTFVTKSIQNKTIDPRCKSCTSWWDFWKLHASTNLLYLVVLALFLASLIPAFEFWISVKPHSAMAAVPVLAAALGITSAMFLVLLWLSSIVTYPKGQNKATTTTSPWSRPLFFVHVTVCWSAQTWSFLPLLWGTPLFGFVAKFLGASVEGRFLYLGEQLFDFPLLEIADRTILDGVMVNGHYSVFQETTIGKDQVSGLLHEGTLCFAHSRTTKEESGPWRAIF